MRYELTVGLRYLRSRRSEAFISLITLISIVGVMIGVMTLNIVLAVMTGFEEDLRSRILGFNPHIVLLSYAGAIRDYGKVVEQALEVPGVKAAQPLVYTQVMLSSEKNVAGVVVRGVPGTGKEPVVDVGKHLVAGKLAGLGAPYKIPVEHDGKSSEVTLSGILIGRELAQQLGVAVGDPVSMVSLLGRSTPAGVVPKLKRFVIAGLFDSGMYDYDATLVYMSLADAQKFFGLGDAVTAVEIRVEDIYHADSIARSLEKKLGPPYRARDWMEVNRNLFVAFRLEKAVYFVVLLLIVLVAAFNIVATLIMVVMEKRRDIAVLKSMGATNRSIASIFMFKGAVIGLIGTLLGAVGGWAGCWVLARYKFIELPKDVFYVSTLPVKIYPGNFLLVAVASVVICLIATIYPARQAAGLAPVEVIRYE